MSSEYTSNLDVFISLAAKWSDGRMQEWLANFLREGHTVPFFPGGRIVDQTNFILSLVNRSTTDSESFVQNLETAITNCFFDISSKDILRDEVAQGYVRSLFELSGYMKVKVVSEKLESDILDEKYKGVDMGYGSLIDLHSMALTALFSIYHGESSKQFNQIIKRDISDPKYSLNCFNHLVNDKTNILAAVDYIPAMVNQIDKTMRPIVDCVEDYLCKLCEQGYDSKKIELESDQVEKFKIAADVFNQHSEKYQLEISDGYLAIKDA